MLDPLSCYNKIPSSNPAFWASWYQVVVIINFIIRNFQLSENIDYKYFVKTAYLDIAKTKTKKLKYHHTLKRTVIEYLLIKKKTSQKEQNNLWCFDAVINNLK